jgi:hypothetical protein
MRYDMHEVVIERPRRGGFRTYHDHRPRIGKDPEQLENLPAKQGMFRPHIYGGEHKEFSDLLGPLQRFLVRQVGRTWNDVYSEIRQRISPRSTVQIHILGHLDGMVSTKLIERDGKLFVFGPYWVHEVFPGDLYVNPRTGILCRMPERRRYPRPTPPTDVVVLAPESELRLVNGIWYWVVFADVPAPSVDAEGRTIRSIAVDCFTGKEIPYPGRYRIGKRQANHTDLKRHGLSNKAPSSTG